MLEKSVRVISSNMFHFLLPLSTAIGILEGEDASKAKPLKGGDELKAEPVKGDRARGEKNGEATSKICSFFKNLR